MDGWPHKAPATIQSSVLVSFNDEGNQSTWLRLWKDQGLGLNYHLKLGFYFLKVAQPFSSWQQ